MVVQALEDIRAEEEKLLQDQVNLDRDSAAADEEINYVTNGVPATSKISQTLTCLPTTPAGTLDPAFHRYYRPPWGRPIFYSYNDPFNDLVTIIYGPRGGGKTISGVTISIIDGQMKGIPCISNVPFAWVAKDANGKLYKVESIPFDQELFAKGDLSLKYKRLLIDEGNYLADRMRSTSNKNLAMTDILQQARKFRMCVIFCTINYAWLDPRITGSLLDVMIECNDLYYQYYGRKNKLQKGCGLTWKITDQSGKITGHQNRLIDTRVFNARCMWGTYNTENFVDPREARKKLLGEQKMITDEFGKQIPEVQWYEQMKLNAIKLARARPDWESVELWEALGINDPGQKMKAGRYMRSLGVDKTTRRSDGISSYDLSELAAVVELHAP